jgi:hypothetical protein
MIPDIDGRSPASLDELGFTDGAFNARYDGKRSSVPGSPNMGRAIAPRPNAHTKPASPRSRNSFRGRPKMN